MAANGRSSAERVLLRANIPAPVRIADEVKLAVAEKHIFDLNR
jgi:hypothetical protein